MNPGLPDHDLALLDRFLDGALADVDAAALRTRLEREPALRQGLEARRELRRGFQVGRDATFRASGGFAERVLVAARRLPEPGAEVAGSVALLCRRILLAAAAAVVGAILWQSGLLRDRDDGTLQAAPDEVQRVIDELDAKIHGREAGGAHK